METRSDRRFETLYRAHAREVHAYCLRRTTSEEAKDATSDVFLVAWRRIDEVPQADEALPWLYVVARNVLSNRARSSRRRDRLTVKVSQAFEGSVPGPEPQLVRREEHRDLVKALSKLPDKDQEVLRLVEWENLSREQVADMFYVSRAAIDKRIARAYKKMAKSLGVSTPDVLPTPVNVEEGGEA